MLKSTVAVFGFVIFLTTPVSAQQITSTTVPETRNPQSTQTEIIKSESGVQQSPDSLLLKSNSVISFDGGKALPAPEENSSSSIAWWVWISGIICAFIAGLVITALLQGDVEYQKMPTEKNFTNSPKKIADKKALTDSSPKPKTSRPTKKKKRRTKSKKKR